MKERRIIKLLIFAFLTAILFIFPVFAGSVRAAGLWAYELGTPDMGTASAGRGALAGDASVALFNPAGMTKLDRSQLFSAVQGVWLNTKFDVEQQTFGGGNGDNAGGFIPVGSLAYVYSVNSKLKLGVGAASYFGAGLDYDNDWAGRYYVQEAEFLTFGVTPAIGYRINKWLSLGGGATVLYAKLDQKTAINNQLTDPGVPDGEIKIDDDDVGYGFNLGALIEPREDLRFSLTYRSRVEVEFKDVADIKGIGPNLQALLDLIGVTSNKVDLEMELPQEVLISGYYDLTDKVALVASAGWQDWSAFGKTTLTVRSTNTTSFEADRNFKDTWHAAIGARYRFADPWLWSVGFAYDSSPVDDKDRTPDMPLDRQIRLGTGLQYNWNQNVTLGAAYTYVDLGDAKIDQQGGPLQGVLKGDYKTDNMHVVALNLIWRF
ncbi:MAG: transporter [Desulfobacterales bacterium]|nr:MAG: transporter [Desulfobacterales bacterium]